MTKGITLQYPYPYLKHVANTKKFKDIKRGNMTQFMGWNIKCTNKTGEFI